MQALERFVLWLLFVGALCAGAWFGAPAALRSVVGQHTQAVLTAAHDQAQGGALTAGTADAGQAGAACSRAVRSARGAGYASAKADDAPPPENGVRRTYDGAAFMNQIGGAP